MFHFFISNKNELTFVNLRYILEGYRPNKTVWLPNFSIKMRESKFNEIGISKLS